MSEPEDWRVREFEPFERGEVRDTLDERKFRKTVIRVSGKYLGWLTITGGAVVAGRDTIVTVAKAIVAMFGAST